MTQILKKRLDKKTEIELEFSHIQTVIANEVYNAMDRLGLTRAKLAEKLTISPEYLAGMLDGDMPITIKMMVQMANALGFTWQLTPTSLFRPAGKFKGVAR